MKLWSVEELAREGRELNRELKRRYMAYCERTPRLDTAVAFALLCVGNSLPVDDYARRDAVLNMLSSNKPPSDKSLRALEIRMWSLVRKGILHYRSIVAQCNRPTLQELVDQQPRSAVSLSWSTLMPDKVYAIARFSGKEPPERIGRLQSPFGKFVQAAFTKYTGVRITGQPTPTHHSALRNFERSWAEWAGGGCTTLDINSGLYLFGFKHLS